jgi:hypothetical protein
VRDRRDRVALGTLLTVLLGLLALAVAPPAVAQDEAPGVSVEDAVLRWGMSNEANNRAPSGAYNFFSAGAAAKPAGGEMTAAEWSARSGAVAIEKWNGTRYVPATWAGLRTDASGTTITDYRSGRFSGHQYVFSGGTGVVDPDAGTAHIAWTGTVSVIFYGGFPFFRITDPELDVRADGTGTLTGTVSGLGSSRDDPGESFEITPARVTLADLPSVGLGTAGFTATPAYDGVRVNVGGTSVTDSFPQSFVDVMDRLGTAAFWHRSGGAVDAAKKALPVTVSYDASAPVEEVPPPASTPAPEVENTAPPAPEIVRETVTRTVAVPASAVPAAPAAAAAPSAAPALAPVVAPAIDVPTVLASAATTATSGSGDDARLWWLGGLLLTLAALVLAGALLVPAHAPRRHHA